MDPDHGEATSTTSGEAWEMFLSMSTTRICDDISNVVDPDGEGVTSTTPCEGILHRGKTSDDVDDVVTGNENPIPYFTLTN